MTPEYRSKVQAMIDEALAPLRAQERAGGSGDIRLSEAQRQQRFQEAYERQEAREKRELKQERKQSRRLFESLGMTGKQAKRAAKAGMPESRSPIRAVVTFSEDETSVREAQRQLRGVERKVERAELKEGRRVFESIGMNPDAAKLAAAGRR